MDPKNILPFFPLLFIGMWVLVSFVVSRFGWSILASKYKAIAPFDGRSIHFVSLNLNSFANYNNAVTLKYNSSGIYLKPIILFKLFHAPLYIPYSEITHVETKGFLLFKQARLSIGKPHLMTIKLQPRTFNKFKDYYENSKVLDTPLPPRPQ